MLGVWACLGPRDHEGLAVSGDSAHGARDVGVVVSGDVPFSAVNVGVVSAEKDEKLLVSYPLKRTIND